MVSQIMVLYIHVPGLLKIKQGTDLIRRYFPCSNLLKVPTGTNCAQIVRPLHVRPNALFYFIRYDRRNSGASRGIRTLDTWFRRPSNENDKLYEIRRIRYHRISCRSYAVPFSFRRLSGRQLRPTLRPAILFLSHTGAPCLPSLSAMCGRTCGTPRLL